MKSEYLSLFLKLIWGYNQQDIQLWAKSAPAPNDIPCYVLSQMVKALWPSPTAHTSCNISTFFVFLKLAKLSLDTKLWLGNGGQWTSQKVHAGMLWHGRLVRRVLSLVTLLRLPWWPSSLSRLVILGHGTLDDRKEDSLLPDDECRTTEMSSTGNYLPKKWKFHHYLITFMPQCYNEWELEHSSNKKHAKVPKNNWSYTVQFVSN